MLTLTQKVVRYVIQLKRNKMKKKLDTKKHVKDFQGQMKTINEDSKRFLLSLLDRKTEDDFLDAVKEFSGQEDEEFCGSIGDFLENIEYSDDKEAKKAFKIIEAFGGEGEGDSAHLVVEWNKQFWFIPAYYSSYEGKDYQEDDTYEVYPKIIADVSYKKL